MSGNYRVRIAVRGFGPLVCSLCRRPSGFQIGPGLAHCLNFGAVDGLLVNLAPEICSMRLSSGLCSLSVEIQTFAAPSSFRAVRQGELALASLAEALQYAAMHDQSPVQLPRLCELSIEFRSYPFQKPIAAGPMLISR